MQASEGGESAGLPLFALPRGVDVEVLVNVSRVTHVDDQTQDSLLQSARVRKLMANERVASKDWTAAALKYQAALKLLNIRSSKIHQHRRGQAQAGGSEGMGTHMGTHNGTLSEHTWEATAGRGSEVIVVLENL
jgi:hypothetical protein